MINFTSSQDTTAAAGTGFTVNWLAPPPDDEPPAGVPARPKPAPGAPPAAALVPA